MAKAAIQSAAATITVAREALLPALTLVNKAVERKSTIPVLQNLMIDMVGDRMTIAGTDLDCEMHASLPARSTAAVRLTVPSSLLHDAVRKSAEGVEITIAVEKAGILLAAGRARFRLPTLPAEDFPTIASGDLPHHFTLPAATLARVLDTVAFAISSEATRYYLNGVYLHTDGDHLFAVATDGHRLARMTLALPAGAADMPSIILPRRAVALLQGMLAEKASEKGEAADVAIALSGNKIRFETGAGVLVSKLIDGTFPDYRRVIPTGNENRFTLDRAALAGAVDRVMTIGTGRGTAVKFAFAPEDATESLRLSAVNPETGAANDEVAIEASDGQPVEIGFNGKYCLDMLNATDAKAICFRLGSAGDPAIAEPADGAEPRPLFVLMPMRV